MSVRFLVIVIHSLIDCGVEHRMSTIFTGPNGTVHRLLCSLRRTVNLPVTTVASHRHISGTNICCSTYYDVLNVPHDATQTEIKNSYYQLSMMYHPDRNKGSEQALLKFREVTEAYEILCNPRTRRAYDEGKYSNILFLLYIIIFNVNVNNQCCMNILGWKRATTEDYRPTKDELNQTNVPEPDDAQTRFYKQHMRRADTPDSYDRKHYSFDEWSRVHYTRTFAHQQSSKRTHDLRHRVNEAEKNSEMGGMIIFTLVFIIIMGFVCKEIIDSSYKNNTSKKPRS